MVGGGGGWWVWVRGGWWGIRFGLRRACVGRGETATSMGPEMQGMVIHIYI